MTAITGTRRSLLGVAAAGLAARARGKGGSSRLAAAISEHAMTFAAVAAVDYGVFHLSFAAGWIAVGVSLFLLDFAVRG